MIGVSVSMPRRRNASAFLSRCCHTEKAWWESCKLIDEKVFQRVIVKLDHSIDIGNLSRIIRL